jgi:phosphoglycerate dehydrogenase-like enzyme
VTSICLPDAEARDCVGTLPGGIDVVIWDGASDPVPGLDGVEVLVPPYMRPPTSAEALKALASLRLVQLLSAGVDSWLKRLPPGVVLCNGRGVHGGSTAELAVGGIVSSLRELPRHLDAQRAHRWDQHSGVTGLDGRRVLLLGAGDIGTRVAASLTPLGAEVTLVARHARDGVRALTELSGLLPEHQVVVIAVPYTTETHQLVDADFLASMPDGALLVNVARGAIVNTNALLAELTSERLHAFLDVTDPEPLPVDHPLWVAPHLQLTPHIGGGTLGWQQRAYRLVREQVIRFHRGEPLQNVVKVADGY